MATKVVPLEDGNLRLGGEGVFLLRSTEYRGSGGGGVVSNFRGPVCDRDLKCLMKCGRGK